MRPCLLLRRARGADGLAYAHDIADEGGRPLGVIHRDVNPSNIFLRFDGAVKLFDFGLAKAEGRLADTSAGIVKGKLPYLSPEQVFEFPLDRRADIFTLGTTLWEMIPSAPFLSLSLSPRQAASHVSDRFDRNPSA